LRAAIDRAFHGEPCSERFEVRSLSTRRGDTRLLEVICQPQPAAKPDQTPELVTILVQDLSQSEEQLAPPIPVASLGQDVEQATTRLQQVTEQATIAAELQETLQQTASLLGRVREQLAQDESLTSEFDEARRELLQANQELTRTNELLRQQNEDLMVAQEEAAAAAEEVETLSEEQQATNEELETLNEELQATVEELNTTNDDLEARTIELLSLAEQSELASVLNGLPDPILLFSKSGQPVLANAAYRELFGMLGLRAEDEQGVPLPVDATPQRLATGGEPFTIQFVAMTADGHRRRFEAVGRPVQSKEPLHVVVIRRVSV
jgi:two-component system CheB/CheR fusion protein